MQDVYKRQGYDSILFDLKSQDGTVNYSIDYNETVNARVTAEHPIDLQQTCLLYTSYSGSNEIRVSPMMVRQDSGCRM